MSDSEWQAILDRDTGDEATTMHSMCGEYNCTCHYERPVILKELEQLRMNREQCNAMLIGMADRLYICSRLLTAAAERLGWNSEAVQDLTSRLDKSIYESVKTYANFQQCRPNKHQ